MGYFGYYIVFAVFGVIFLAISWIVTGLLHLSGMALMVVRMVLMGLVFALWGLFHWQRQKKQRRQET